MHSAGAVSGRVRSAAAGTRPDSPGCTGLHRVAPGQDPTHMDHTVGEGKRGIPGRESRSLGGFTRLPCDVNYGNYPIRSVSLRALGLGCG